jgi:hypothetical protein
MHRANVGSSVHSPAHAIPDLLQVIEYPSKERSRFRAKQSWNVFSQKPSGARLAEYSDDLTPEITLVTRRLA